VLPPKKNPALPQKKKSWANLLSIPTFAAILAGFGCSLQNHKTDTATLTAFPPPKKIAAPLLGQTLFPNAPKDLYADCIIAIDAKTGKTLYEKNADKRVAVASTQKLLTALVSLEEGPLDAPIAVSFEAAMLPPTKAYLRWMQTYTREELLKATLIESANDAAQALCEAKNKSAFIDKMNRKAQTLGAKNSHFTNAHGLDDADQYSTARDLAKIAFHAYRNPFIRNVTAQITHDFKNGPGFQTLKNTNQLIYGLTFNGMKGGFTHKAQKTLIASAKRGDREVIIVLLRTSPTSIYWEADRLWKWCLRTP